MRLAFRHSHTTTADMIRSIVSRNRLLPSLLPRSSASALPLVAKRQYSSHSSEEPNFLDQVQLYFHKASDMLNEDYEPGLLNLINEVDCVYEFIIPHVRTDKASCMQ